MVTQEQTSAKSVGRAIDRFGRLTGLCLNAGTFGPCHRMHNAEPAKWMKAFEVNVLSHLHTVSEHALRASPQCFASK